MNETKNPFAGVLPKARELVAQMTLEEKASLCSGLDFWHTKGVERLGVPSVMVTDGPHGLRKQPDGADHLGINRSVLSTCFPTAVATACSFDPDLLREMGCAMGEECVQENVAVILGPAANIKRSPLCGRNFEYISEDPLVTGETATALIEGIQSKNVGTSMKHYLVNNQEKARLTSNSIVDERALREIYMAGFEMAVKKAQPWTLMCSYNKINGTYASDNKRMMTDIPRGEWGFAGAIVTDWGAMNDRVEAINAGLDLEMPANGGITDQQIVEAVQAGRLDETAVDACAVRMTALALQAAQNSAQPYNAEAHNQLARKIACESAVLLQNNGTLPTQKTAKVALIGAFAQTPRYQGAGSSKICPHKITSVCDAFTEAKLPFAYSAGYDADTDTPDDALIAKAVETAKSADVVFAVIGLPDRYESEGFDRTHLDLPASHNKLMDALLATKKPVVAVVLAGGVVLMPWRDKASAILMMHLSGQNVGEAARDLLFGDANPCGKLAETFPLALQDVPCLANFGKGGNCEYRESIYVGYRYYDKVKKDVAYPFGHGLSYTSFAYSDLHLSSTAITDTQTLTASVTVTNTGAVAGKEIVQLYVGAPEGAVFKPVRELRAYQKVALAPGESKTVQLALSRRAFAYYNVKAKDWSVDSGVYRIEVGASSRDLRLSAEVSITAANVPAPDYRAAAPDYYAPAPTSGGGFNPAKAQFETVLGCAIPAVPPERPFTLNSTLGQLKVTFIGKQIYNMVGKSAAKMLGDDPDLQTMVAAMAEDMPLRQMAMMSGGAMTPARMNALLDMMNGHFFKGLGGMLKH